MGKVIKGWRNWVNNWLYFDMADKTVPMAVYGDSYQDFCDVAVQEANVIGKGVRAIHGMGTEPDAVEIYRNLIKAMRQGELLVVLLHDHQALGRMCYFDFATMAERRTLRMPRKCLHAADGFRFLVAMPTALADSPRGRGLLSHTVAAELPIPPSALAA